MSTSADQPSSGQQAAADAAIDYARELIILFVEDSPMDARLLMDSLRDSSASAFFQLTHVPTLTQACEAIAGGEYDCVLLDLDLPDGKGIGNVRRLLELKPQITIVVMTGNDSDEVGQQAIHSGAQEYLIKGQIETQALTRLMRHAVQRNELLQQLKVLREREYFMATHDALTGLPNRQLFEDRAAQFLSRAQRRGEQLAICYLDLDGFKPVNDSFGHSVGDVLLRAVADCLSETIRDGDTVARVGGDEFVLILYPLENKAQAQQIASRVIERIQAIKQAEGHTVQIAASIGISLFPDDGASLHQLQQNADTAMYHSKRRRRGGSAFFKEEMLGQAVNKQLLISEMEKALRESRFTTQFQPWVDVTDGQIRGLEALLRWRDEDGKLRYPSQFIKTAGDSGQILKIARVAHEHSVTHWNTWRDGDSGAGQLALNLSLRELRDTHYLRELAAMFDRLKVPRNLVQFHLDAGELLRLDEQSLRCYLKPLRAAGYRLVLDQLSGNELQQASQQYDQFDEVRVSASDASIQLLVTSALERHKQIVVVGVETEDQVEQLRAMGCTLMQGFVFSQPLSAEQVPGLLKS